MSIRSDAVSLVRAMGVAFTVLGLAVDPATRAQPADLALCDRVAADPSDPDKPASVAGVREIAPSDIPTAIQYCRTAAAKSRRAMYQLGRAHAANRQYPEAVGAYRKAIDKGSTTAMVELGVMFGTGTGVPQDAAQARALFERAAQGGNPRGVTNLAALSGGAPPSDPQSRALFTKAAESGSAEAQYQLGLTASDDVTARAWFEKAAAQNHAGALERLGAFAQSGRGGPQDASAAKAYYERAAALGNEDAKAALESARCRWAIRDKQGKVVTKLCF
ncbi:MAG: sel1 repeat family protein [Xanthobacteraceae bacterium]|nr:sel1 repeat family protein [Xanthobacteraceae bacterium]